MARLSIPKVNGRFPAKHAKGVDPGLVGLRAFEHPVVREWHRWLLEEYRPQYSVALVTPCSNVKPYPLSPTSRKIRGLLRRLGLWDEAGDRPRGVEWLYLSDLLILVPYEKAWDYPACCYELHPEELMRSPRRYNMVVDLLARVVERLVDLGLERVVVYLPRKHLKIWEDARHRASKWPVEHRVKYNIFSLHGLEETLQHLTHQHTRRITLDAWLKR